MSDVGALSHGGSVVDVMKGSPESLVDAWLARLRAAAKARPGDAEADAETGRRTAMDLFGHFAAVFGAQDYADTGRPEYVDLVARLKEFGRQQAVRGRSAVGSMGVPMLFKEEVVSRLTVDGQVPDIADLTRFGVVMDRLTSVVVDSYTTGREDLIGRQSRAILELSTPVITLWDSIVLLPLVGVIDTARAQQMMERLLEAVVQAEAQVALLDITGVPIIDTRVARHLLVTIDAARMLGAETIMTGISADAAMTLTGLGIDLSRVRTKGSLKSGVVEALRLVGRAVRPLRPATG